MSQCTAKTKSGDRCRNTINSKQKLCSIHLKSKNNKQLGGAISSSAYVVMLVSSNEPVLDSLLLEHTKVFYDKMEAIRYQREIAQRTADELNNEYNIEDNINFIINKGDVGNFTDVYAIYDANHERFPQSESDRYMLSVIIKE